MARFRTAHCSSCNAERLVVWTRRHEGGRWRNAACCQVCGELVEPPERKMRNQPTRTREGKLRQSKKEARREDALKLWAQANAIQDLRCQVPFTLEVYGTPEVEALLVAVESWFDPTIATAPLRKRKLAAADFDGMLKLARNVRLAKHRISKYIADFVYVGQDGQLTVEDVKGRRSMADVNYRLFQVKAKLMLAAHGLEVKEW